jgi:fumarate reductase subunit C
MVKKNYKYLEKRRKINKRTIVILFIIITISVLSNLNQTLDSIWILDFIKNPLNVIAIVSLIEPLLIIEPNKKEIYQTFKSQHKILEEEYKINAQIEKDATL